MQYKEAFPVSGEPRRITEQTLDNDPAVYSQDAYTILKKGQLGTGKVLTVGHSGNLKQIVNVWGPNELANVLSVCLTGPMPLGINAAARAVIAWGVGGTFGQVEVDCMNGVCLTVVASSLTVSVADDTSDSPNLELPVTYSVGAFVGLNPTPKATRLQRSLNLRTVGEVTIANTASADFTIPAFAQSVQILRAPDVDVDAAGYMHAIAVRELASVAAPTRVLGQVNVGSGVDCPIIPLTNRSRVLRITNIDTINLTTMVPRLIFYLGLN